MRIVNQYSDIIDEYNMENGTDIYIEYKSADDDRKKEIEDWLYNLLREKDEVPSPVWTDAYADDTMISLSNVDSHNTYQDGNYGFNPIGVNFLNFFFPEIYDVSKPDKPWSVNVAFRKEKFMRRVCRKTLKFDRDVNGIFRWIILCGAGYCTNYRPASAKALYEIFGVSNDCKVLDTSSGYGARLLGAHFAENVSEYIGIDPNTKDSCDKLIEFLDSRFDTGTHKEVYKMGSEDFTVEAFPQYKEYFNLYFTSPPYFDTEKYSEDETQSYIKFPTLKQWITGFYRSTIYNACDMLRKDGIFSINISEKTAEKLKDLTKLFLADKGWYIYKTDKYLLHVMPGWTSNEDGDVVNRDLTNDLNFEPIWYAKHYTQLYKEGLIDEETFEKYESRVNK